MGPIKKQVPLIGPFHFTHCFNSVNIRTKSSTFNFLSQLPISQDSQTYAFALLQMGRNVWISNIKDRKIGREGRKINTLFAWLVTILQRAVLKVSFERKKGARNSRWGALWGGGAEETLKDFTLTALLIKNYVISNWSLVSPFSETRGEVLKSSTVGRSPSFSFTYRLLEQKSLTQRGIYPYSCKLRSNEDYKPAHHISERNLHKLFCMPLWALWSF